MSQIDAAYKEIDRLRAENARMRELKTPATRQLLNVTKGLLDNAEAECAKLRTALAIIADWSSARDKLAGEHKEALLDVIDAITDLARAALEETK